jgi:hypothetical protein
MKLETLLEAPDFIDKEMPVIMNGTLNFYSNDTIKREFDVIGTVKIASEIYWTVLKKDKSFAVIGQLGKRKEDDKVGIQIIGTVEFKNKPDFSFDKLIKTNKNVLQVDGVQIHDKSRFRGVGFNLYKSLVDYGYVVVSDHVQYRGGKKLWEKIANLSTASNYSVYIINDGEVSLDDNGDPLKYNGTNLADDKIWATPATKTTDSRRYVLLLMKKNDNKDL